MKDEQLESMCRSLLDILQRSLRLTGDTNRERERKKEGQTRRPKEVETKRTWNHAVKGKAESRKESEEPRC